MTDARAVYETALQAQMDGDYAIVQKLASELIAHAKASGDDRVAAQAYRLLGNVCLHNFDGDSAERYYQTALQYYGSVGDELGAGMVLMNLGTVAIEIHLDAEEAGRLYEQCLTIFRKYDDAASIALTLANLGEVSRLGGDYAQALAYGKESLTTFKELGQLPRAAWQCINIAHYHLLKREHVESFAMLGEARAHLDSQHNPVFVAGYFEIWFLIACDLKRLEDGARLLGFIDLYRVQHNTPRHAGMMPWFSRETERMHRRLDAEVIGRYFREGEDLSLDDAHALTEKIARDGP